jgi:hypothetical protein
VSALHDAFVAEVESGPIVDNATDPAVIGQYGLEWDGDRCHECRRPTDDGVALCGDCAQDAA